ncbi:MAG: hypothetical protein JNL67_09650 [Planctomycetaceae bacterium]|nr:hypothetical protein [Planctomycetaceae bacterium]
MSDQDTPLEPNQPRDSRLDAFLRRAASVLAEHRQWSAQTQIKLKILAKELKLPPELYQTALEQLADPNRLTTLTRYEQAFCEYLERQFGTLPDMILSRTQEKKAITYGQQKFQLTPDACERCVERVAEKLNVARISDGQALAYVQSEISRWVGRKELAEDQLREQVQTLASQWAIELPQVEKLLQTEFLRRSAKKRRALIHRISIGVGLFILSIGLVVTIIVLGKTLTQESSWRSQNEQKQQNNLAVTRPNSQIDPPVELMAPAWWTPNQKQMLERLQEEAVEREILIALTSADSSQRSKAYPKIWQWFVTRDRQLIARGADQVRWLRQPMVQESMLDWYWNEPEPRAARELISELDRLSSLSLRIESTEANQTLAKTDLGLEALSDFLNATDADHLLLRAFQKCVAQTSADSLVPNMQSRIDLIRTLRPMWRATELNRQSDVTLAAYRDQWLTEAAERCYIRMQPLWHSREESRTMEPGHDNRDKAWRKAVADAVEPLRLASDPQIRAHLLIVFWSAIVGIDPTLSDTAWPEVTASMELVSSSEWGPLVESWSTVPEDSAWSTRLQLQWQAIAESKQRAWLGRRSMDAIWLQNALGIEVITTQFQRDQRREIILSEIKELESRLTMSDTSQDLTDWEKLSWVTSLATCLLNDSSLQTFDTVLLQSQFNSAGTSGVNSEAVFVLNSDFDKVWEQLQNNGQVDSYTLAVQEVAQWWQENRLLSIPQSQRLVNYLKNVIKPEQQMSWLIAFQKHRDVQGPSSHLANGDSDPMRTTALQQLANQPSVALALADLLETDPSDFEAGLGWLYDQEIVAPAASLAEEPPARDRELKSLITEFRKNALKRLQQQDISARDSKSNYLVRRFELAFRSERTGSENLPQVNELFGSGNRNGLDTLTKILLVHDVWATRMAEELLDDANVWIADYRAQIDQQVLAENKLWVAEWLVLKLLQRRIEQGSR